MSELQTINTGGADELVILPRATYDRLIADLEDAQDIASSHAFAAREAAGEVEWVPWEVVKRLRREHPLTVWREHRGFTQRGLAAKVSMTPAQLSEIEAGKKTGSVATLRKLANALGVTVDDLLVSEAER
ncbi:helix-turn-helix transcriptional regulator [Sphingomonas sp.]|uniref:helix-turn-helix domain-containing protein n=1 Tax=Sphingomonas sp. TaxID=28214 RepID=UPI00286CDCE2|nr:helix-turn-helix transcriptional regulator [Sphingomonas sp.]